MSLAEQPLGMGLGLAAGLEGLAAVRGREGDDAMGLATGAILLAAAARPELRMGALVTAGFGHSLRAAALTFDPRERRQKQRLAVELTLSGLLAALLLQAVQAARWEER